MWLRAACRVAIVFPVPDRGMCSACITEDPMNIQADAMRNLIQGHWINGQEEICNLSVTGVEVTCRFCKLYGACVQYIDHRKRRK
jgi:hypothetical protein